MSIARGFGLNGKSLYTNVCKPCEVNLNFIVDSTNGNGLGIRSLKSNGYVDNVFMHTSSTPGKNNGQTNPNPAPGLMVVQFKNNFNYYLGGYTGTIAPPASTSATSTTAGNAYFITSLGTTTLAQFQAAGLPQGLTPTVGQAFIATATGSLGGTGTLGTPGASPITNLSVVGDPNQTLNNSSIASNGGAIIVLQLLAPTSSDVTTPVATAPADGSVVGMLFSFDASSVTIDGL